MTKTILIQPPMREDPDLITSRKGISSRVSTRGCIKPLGIMSIATYLNSQNQQVELIDGEYTSPEQIKSRISKERPQFVGMSPNLMTDFKVFDDLAHYSKELGAKVVCGGAYATSEPERFLINPEIDYIVGGDGEEAMLRLVHNTSLDKISGLIYNGGGGIVRNPQKLCNLDGLPFEDHSLLDFEPYWETFAREFNTPFRRPVSIAPYRGCMKASLEGRCTFCARQETSWRGRAPKEVWNHIDWLNESFGVDYILDVGDSLVGNKEWFKEFYEESQRHPRLGWRALVCSHELDEEIVNNLSQMGAYEIFLGIESGNNNCLKLSRKSARTSDNINAVRLLGDKGIKVLLATVLGLRGETRESVRQTQEHIKQLGKLAEVSEVYCSVNLVLPGSDDFRKMSRRHGMGELYNPENPQELERSYSLDIPRLQKCWVEFLRQEYDSDLSYSFLKEQEGKTRVRK